MASHNTTIIIGPHGLEGSPPQKTKKPVVIPSPTQPPKVVQAPPTPPPTPKPTLPPSGVFGPQAPQSLLAQLAGGQAPGIIQPSLGNYTQPYDQAAQSAHDNYNQAIPDIVANYAAMRDQLAQSHQAAQDHLAGVTANELAQRQQVQGSIQAQNNAPIADIQKQFGGAAPAATVNGVAATNAQQQANLGLQGANQDQLLREMAAQQTSSNQGRVADSQLAEAGAKATAQNNLTSLLNQIGLKKADATRQYTQDANQASVQQYELNQKAQANNPLYQTQIGSAVDQYKSQANQGAFGAVNSAISSMPTTSQVFSDLYQHAAGDPALMQQILTGNAEKIKNGTYKLGDGSVLKKKIDPSYLNAKVQQYAAYRDQLLQGQ